MEYLNKVFLEYLNEVLKVLHRRWSMKVLMKKDVQTCVNYMCLRGVKKP